jgi:hypothetical protein
MVHEFRGLQSWKFDLQEAIHQLQAEIMDIRMLIGPLVDAHIPVELTQPTLDFGNQTASTTALTEAATGPTVAAKKPTAHSGSPPAVRLHSCEEHNFNNACILWNDPATWPMMEDNPKFNAAFVQWLREQIVAWMDSEGREMMRPY